MFARSSGGALGRAARESTVGGGDRRVARMPRRTVRDAVPTDSRPLPVTRTAREEGSPAHLPPSAPLYGKGRYEQSGADAAQRERPEDRPLHLGGRGVEAINEAADPSALTIRTPAHVARQRRRDAASALAVDEHFDGSALAESRRFRVEPLESFEVENFAGARGALGEDFGIRLLGCLALRSRSFSLSVGRRELMAPPWRRLRTADARLLPRIKRSGSGTTMSRDAEPDPRRRGPRSAPA
jgi:hypothetical protein